MSFSNKEVSNKLAEIIRKGTLTIFQRGTANQVGIGATINVNTPQGRVQAYSYNVVQPGEVTVFYDTTNRRYVAWQQTQDDPRVPRNGGKLIQRTELQFRKTRGNKEIVKNYNFVIISSGSKIRGFKKDEDLTIGDYYLLYAVNKDKKWYGFYQSFNYDNPTIKVLSSDNNTSNMSWSNDVQAVYYAGTSIVSEKNIFASDVGDITFNAKGSVYTVEDGVQLASFSLLDLRNNNLISEEVYNLAYKTILEQQGRFRHICGGDFRAGNVGSTGSFIFTWVGNNDFIGPIFSGSTRILIYPPSVIGFPPGLNGGNTTPSSTTTSITCTGVNGSFSPRILSQNIYDINWVAVISSGDNTWHLPEYKISASVDGDSGKIMANPWRTVYDNNLNIIDTSTISSTKTVDKQNFYCECNIEVLSGGLVKQHFTIEGDSEVANFWSETSTAWAHINHKEYHERFKIIDYTLNRTVWYRFLHYGVKGNRTRDQNLSFNDTDLYMGDPGEDLGEPYDEQEYIGIEDISEKDSYAIPIFLCEDFSLYGYEWYDIRTTRNYNINLYEVLAADGYLINSVKESQTYTSETTTNYLLNHNAFANVYIYNGNVYEITELFGTTIEPFFYFQITKNLYTLIDQPIEIGDYVRSFSITNDDFYWTGGNVDAGRNIHNYTTHNVSGTSYVKVTDPNQLWQDTWVADTVTSDNDTIIYTGRDYTNKKINIFYIRNNNSADVFEGTISTITQESPDYFYPESLSITIDKYLGVEYFFMCSINNTIGHSFISLKNDYTTILCRELVNNNFKNVNGYLLNGVPNISFSQSSIISNKQVVNYADIYYFDISTKRWKRQSNKKSYVSSLDDNNVDYISYHPKEINKKTTNG
jgi:hypothetical protein